MNIKQKRFKYSALVMTFLLTTCLVFGSSSAYVTSVITVGQWTQIGSEETNGQVPFFVIELKNGLREGDRFYLHLKGGSWQADVQKIVLTQPQEPNDPLKLRAKILSDTELEIYLEQGNIEEQATLKIPLYIQINEEEASVRIDHNNTPLTTQTIVVAKSTSTKLQTKVISKLEKVLEEGVLPTIEFSEEYGGQLKYLLSQGNEASIMIRLDNTDFEFVERPEARLIGTRAFEGIGGDELTLERVTPQQLRINLPKALINASRQMKGSFRLEGIGIRQTSRQPEHVKANAHISSTISEDFQMEAIELGDYTVSLSTQTPDSLLSGKKYTLAFTLEEDLEGALVRERALNVEVLGGVVLDVSEDQKVRVKINDTTHYFEPIMEKEKCIGFSISNLQEAGISTSHRLSFKVDYKIPVALQEDIKLNLSGRALPAEQYALIGTAVPALEVTSEKLFVESGLKDQYGGAVVIKEHQPGTLKEGKSILLKFDTTSIQVTKMPLIEIEGDLMIDEPILVEEGIQFNVTGASSKASTIRLKHFGLSLDGTVAAGKYPMAITGTALSILGNEDYLVDNLPFVYVDQNEIPQRQIKFRLGDESYWMDGRYYHIDSPAYLADGRVMVPLKDFIQAIGIASKDTHYDSETKQFTLYYKNQAITFSTDKNNYAIEGNDVPLSYTTKLSSGDDLMVPLSDLCTLFDLELKWDEALKTATIVAYMN